MANVDCRISRALQSYTITYPSPDETQLAKPEALPTSEPETPQIEFTIGSQHMPTVSPAGLSYMLTALLYAAGKNTDTASRTVYYRILKNGANVATGSASVAANTFYTWNHAQFLGINVGDVLGCKLWASDINVNWSIKALAVFVTRLANSDRRAFTNVSISVTGYPVLAAGNPTTAAISGSYVVSDSLVLGSSVSSSKSYALLVATPTDGFVRVGYGDYSVSSYCATNATYYPRYWRNFAPSAISFRPLTIRV